MVVEYELTDAVAWIYLNRPHRLNAVVPELAAGLVAAVARGGQDGARVIVLAGRGRAFCSGHDLKEEIPSETVLATRRRVEQIQEVTLLLGDRIGAARALELGLVNRVAAAGQHEQAAAELAARLRDQPTLAMALAKQALDRGAECALEEAMAAEVDFAALTVAPAAVRDTARPAHRA